MRPQKVIDPDEVRKLAAIGATVADIASQVGASPATVKRRFQKVIEEGRSSGKLRALGRVFQKGVLNGETRSLELYLINQYGWADRAGPQTIVNVQQNAAGSIHIPEQVKAHLMKC